MSRRLIAVALVACVALVAVPALAKKEKLEEITNKVFFDVEIDGKPAGEPVIRIDVPLHPAHELRLSLFSRCRSHCDGPFRQDGEWSCIDVGHVHHEIDLTRLIAARTLVRVNLSIAGA